MCTQLDLSVCSSLWHIKILRLSVLYRFRPSIMFIVDLFIFLYKPSNFLALVNRSRRRSRESVWARSKKKVLRFFYAFFREKVYFTKRRWLYVVLCECATISLVSSRFHAFVTFSPALLFHWHVSLLLLPAFMWNTEPVVWKIRWVKVSKKLFK